LATFCILTTEANELVRPVHDRMPVIVPREHYGLWLSREVQEPGDLAAVLRPYPADAMHVTPLGPTVNDPKNDGPECLQPAS
jgi:putative SOS response-associated peptidase YedK